MATFSFLLKLFLNFLKLVEICDSNKKDVVTISKLDANLWLFRIYCSCYSLHFQDMKVQYYQHFNYVNAFLYHFYCNIANILVFTISRTLIFHSINSCNSNERKIAFFRFYLHCIKTFRSVILAPNVPIKRFSMLKIRFEDKFG